MTSNHPLQPTQKQRPLSNPCHLFLSRSILVCLVLCPLLPHSPVSRLTSGISELSVGAALNRLGHIALADLLDGGIGGDNRQTLLEARNCLGAGNLPLGRVALLRLSNLAGEEDEAGSVFLETGDVGGEGFGGEILAAWIDRYTDRGRESTGDSGFLCIVRTINT